MNTKGKSPIFIFLSYFKNHKKLFAIDVSCAVGIAAIDLAFPLITRSALYDLLPNQMYRTFFIIMAAVLAKGKTTIYNAACEPYIQQLCKMLCRMGWRKFFLVMLI